MRTPYPTVLLACCAVAALVAPGAIAGEARGPANPPDPADRLDIEATWAGNTYVGNAAKRHVPHMVTGFSVTPDGTVYTGSVWEEACGVVAEIKDGEVTQIPQQLTKHWGNQGGFAVAASDTWLFSAKNDCNGIARFARRSLLYIEPLRRDLGGHVTGVAASADRVYVGCPWRGQILILDHELKDVGALEVAGRETDELAIDAKGRLWVLLPKERSVICFAADGTKAPVEVHLPGDCEPTAIAFTPAGELAVADAGASDQILVYAGLDTAPKLARRIGEAGGVWAPGAKRGEPGALRFNGLSGLGFDRAGTLYVADGSSRAQGSSIQAYGTDRKLKWELRCAVWNECPTTDPRDESLLMGVHAQVRLLPGKNPPWQMTSYTRDPRQGYGNGDPEGDGMMSGLIVGGRTIFFSRKGHQGTPVYRCDGARSALLIPCAFFGEKSIWIDANGDGKRTADEETKLEPGLSCYGWGQWIDERGDYWVAHEDDYIARIPFAGFNAKGVPTWNIAGASKVANPAPFTIVRRLRHVADSDTMYLIGYTADVTRGINEHGVGGRVLARFDHWNGARTMTWSLQPSYHNDSKEGTLGLDMGVVRCIEVVGDYVFCVFANDNAALHHARGHIDVYRTRDGSYVGWIEPPDSIGRVGNQDLSDSVSGCVLKDGRIRLVMEDNECGKAVIFHWRPEAKGTTASVAATPVASTEPLVGHWTFDEAKGLVAKNQAPGGAGEATLKGADWATGVRGGAVDLDGKLTRVEVDGPFATGTMDAFTVALWAYHDADAFAPSGLIGKWRSNDRWDFNLDLNGQGALRFMLASKIMIDTAVVVPNKSWFHLAATSDGTTARIYLDGQLKHEHAAKTAVPDSPDCRVIIGASWDGSWRGKIDDVRIYRRALGADEIHALAERPR